MQLYISIAGLSYFYLSNNHTLAAIFGQELMTPAAQDARLAHMCEVIAGYVAGTRVATTRAIPSRPSGHTNVRRANIHDRPSQETTTMNRIARTRLVALAALLAATSGSAFAQSWKPTHPINLIVPWAAGGSTDQITRVTAGELEKALGQTIVIVNQPGASGSIGTKSALDAPKDGYTWTAGAGRTSAPTRRSAR